MHESLTQPMSKAELVAAAKFTTFFVFATAVIGTTVWTMGDLFLRNPAKWWWVTLPVLPLLGGVWWILWQQEKPTPPADKRRALLLAWAITVLLTQTARWWL